MLSPLSTVTAAITALRLRREGWFCPVPVICVGNATLGGAGKTTVTLDLARRLVARGWGVHVLLRGYGGSARGLHWVAPDEPASVAGDEALLHAAIAPTWTCADRKSGAQALLAACAEVVLMDDGLQNSFRSGFPSSWSMAPQASATAACSPPARCASPPPPRHNAARPPC
jgi:tetraacyldisaccharide 4'-kinase